MSRPDARTYDIARFGLSDMVRTTADLRRRAEEAPDFAAAVESLVRGLRDSFTDAAGAPVLPLVRLYTTRDHAELTPRQRAHVARHHGETDARCLVLAASAGELPAWNDPGTARWSRIIPVPSPSTLPMVAAMASRLGLAIDDVISGPLPGSGGFGVVHVPDALGSAFVPDQRFVVEHGIASVVGFGGVLPGGTAFCVLLFSRVAVPAETAEQFQAVSIGVRVGLLAHFRGDASLPAERDAVRAHLAVLEEASRRQATALEQAVARLRAEADLVDSLQVVGRRLTAQLDIDTLVQDATDAATKATGAAFGAFFYNLVNDYGESYTLFTLSGVPRSAFERFPMPRNTGVFAPTFKGVGTVRSADITADERYGHNPPYRGMPEGHLPVRSYLAVPVVSPSSGEVLGGFFFGHPEPGRFTGRHEALAEGIAGYSAIALDNARLFARQRTMATELARSMLPTIPETPGLRVLSRYLPAATGAEVGGDWFDVIALPVGRTAFVIGDVAGRGVAAAAVMGQIRTAVRSYALLDLPPSEVLRHASELAMATPDADFITCLYAVHDPADDTLAFAGAGHLPAVHLTPDGAARLIAETMGMPLGVGTVFTQRQVAFPPGSRLVLYTDGLVETRGGHLPDGVDALVRGLAEMPPDGSALDALIADLTGGRHEDDVAVLHVHHTGTHRRVATLPLTTDSAAAATARRFTAEHLAAWGLGPLVDRAVTIASELVTNAVRHTGRPTTLRLHADRSRLAMGVGDRDPTVPHPIPAAPTDEHHRGLHIVESFATRWGTRPTADGKVVWAEILLHRDHTLDETW
ncbi:SpoIIE family protein phosphatase [Actinokineospora auranticolor]|uniref:Serine phosphatase RsbU (Regulator of sigma subunit) n=1 Tax=Actinokineospora auranticolor TaxID=155976 RepID=A0A2S6H0J6_9PSEU|nr:SpoIIE family protein phosphatase [Actinokineospora auranticolor]PPK70946.1 serine phosphatase RsbU (regulator of sigma subunit) [Actinokineospora auranticolor]